MTESGKIDNDQSQEIKKREEIIATLIREKKWLLDEFNHRVRNILQVILSLLNTQIYYLNDKSADTVIRDCQRRMFAISLIHRKVSLGEEQTRVAMRPYIKELVSYLGDSFSINKSIRIGQHIGEIDLDVSQAVSVGLIVNEALSNAIKFAFPRSENGVIHVSLLNTGPDRVLLTISDNGIGLPDEYLRPDKGGLGLNLIRGLAGDLEGSIQLKNDNGTFLSIDFKNPYVATNRESQSQQ